MSEPHWTLLRIRLETLRDMVVWVAGGALVVALVDAYSTVQDLRRGFEGQSVRIEWYRYVNAAVSGAGIPLLVASMLLSLAVLLTAGSRVASAFGEAGLDAEDDEDAIADIEPSTE